MGDVLVYLDPSINGRLLAFARPLADAPAARWWRSWRAASRATPTRSRRPTWCSRSSHPALSPYLPEAHQAVLAAAIEERSPNLVLVENTTAGYDVAAAAAAAAGLPFVGYCLEPVARGRARRSRSAPSTAGSCRRRSRTPLPAVFAINSAALHDEPQAAGAGERVQLAPPPELDSLRTTFIEPLEPADEGVDLTTAELIVCVGRGIGGAENVEVAEELATALGAELAASRPVIDSGWVPRRGRSGSRGRR